MTAWARAAAGGVLPAGNLNDPQGFGGLHNINPYIEQIKRKRTQHPFKLMKNLANKNTYQLGMEFDRLEGHYLHKWKEFEDFGTMCSMLGLLFALIEYETNYVYPRIENYILPNSTRLLIALTSLLSVICLGIRRSYKYKWRKLVEQETNPQILHFFRSRPQVITWTLFFEFLITIIQPIPFYDRIFVMSIYRVTYHVKYEALLSEYLYAVMYLRLFILFRNIVTGTIYTDATAKKLCILKYGLKVNARFGIKCITKKTPISFSLALLFLTIVLLGIEIRIFERPYWNEIGITRPDGVDANNNFFSLADAMWCIVITMCTVGYGDYSPGTPLGRCVSAVACLWGGVVTTILIVVMTQTLSLSKMQKKAFLTLSLTFEASRTINSFMIYCHIKNNPHADLKECTVAYTRFQKQLVKFALAKKRVTSIGVGAVTHEEVLLREMKNQLQMVTDKMEEMEEQMDTLIRKGGTKKIGLMGLDEEEEDDEIFKPLDYYGKKRSKTVGRKSQYKSMAPTTKSRGQSILDYLDP